MIKALRLLSSKKEYLPIHIGWYLQYVGIAFIEVHGWHIGLISKESYATLMQMPSLLTSVNDRVKYLENGNSSNKKSQRLNEHKALQN